MGDLVDSLIGSTRLIPVEATRVTSTAILPPRLRLLSRRIDRRHCIWRSWSDGARIWFFEGGFSLELSRERGKPVIELREYDEIGNIRQSLTFVSTAGHGWEKCA